MVFQVIGQHDRVRPWWRAGLADAQVALTRVGPPWNKPNAQHHSGAVPMDAAHASRSAGSLALSSFPRRIRKANANVLKIRGSAWAQQRLPQVDVEGWARQDQSFRFLSFA